ncbi:MAG TPA: right-handed parallel beta-helix repeat-containing protein [Polyangiaceae bacterium]|nr:right-handed parallel beta-helix repeat-containing protein [Polyangiaceae bacterium]
MRGWLFVGATLALGVPACSGSDSEDGAGGSGATSGGSAGAGKAGAAGSSVAAAGRGSGGAGGAAGAGGTAGRGTAGGAGRGGAGTDGGTGAASGSGTGARAGRGTGGAGAAAGSGVMAGEGGTSGSGTAGAATAPTGCEEPAWKDSDFDTVIDVGPGLDVETPSDVAWETLSAGTLVRIHHRAEPYRDKWVVNTTGTANKPVVVLGVPENGVLPVISGDGATTRSALEYWNEERGIVKLGGADAPGGPAAYVTIECLDITSARPGISFDDAGGSSTEYSENAACLYIEDGSYLTLRNNTVHGCGNGIFASSGSSEVLVSGNYVYDNGNVGSQYEHNSYTEARGITFEFNHYGPPCDGCDGNNLKDRSAGTVIRYNWIESGSRELDLVESDHEELVDDPRYHQTFVYGNVLVEPDEAGNSQILHYGGDGSDESMFRKGTLYFYNNTVVSTRGGNTTLFRLSSEEESVDARNNIFSVTADGNAAAISAGMGAIVLADNWLPSGWVDSHDDLTGSIDDQGNVTGTTPGFTDGAAQDFTLAAGSACVGAAGPLASGASGYPVDSEYVKHQQGKTRSDDGDLDVGAFEGE